MLPAKLKIGRKIFPKDLRRGAVFHSPTLSLFVFRSPEDKKSRFAFVVSSKISSKAAERNLLRRRGYATVRKLLPAIKPSFFCVFYFKKGSSKKSFKEIEKETTFLLEKSGILNKPSQ